MYIYIYIHTYIYSTSLSPSCPGGSLAESALERACVAGRFQTGSGKTGSSRKCGTFPTINVHGNMWQMYIICGNMCALKQNMGKCMGFVTLL